MILRELIKIFKQNWIPTDSLEALDKKAEVTRETLLAAGVPSEIILKYDSMPLWAIRGIGPAKAAELWTAGVRPTNLSKYKSILPETTVLALKYKPLARIPRELITKIAEEFVPRGEKTKCTIVGSYRRKRPTSGDIDIMYVGRTHADFDKFLEKVKAAHKKNWIMLATGPSKVAGFFKYRNLVVEVDIWIATDEDKHAMLLYSTGSKLFNVRMRFIAKRKGYKLNQYGLWRNDKLVKTESERDIFEKIGMSYRRPEERE